MALDVGWNGASTGLDWFASALTRTATATRLLLLLLLPRTAPRVPAVRACACHATDPQPVVRRASQGERRRLGFKAVHGEPCHTPVPADVPPLLCSKAPSPGCDANPITRGGGVPLRWNARGDRDSAAVPAAGRRLGRSPVSLLGASCSGLPWQRTRSTRAAGRSCTARPPRGTGGIRATPTAGVALTAARIIGLVGTLVQCQDPS